jgi:type IV secretory pathway VirB2 component (pilin)
VYSRRRLRKFIQMYYICLMASPVAPSTDASALVGGHYATALDNLRSTVKWLVASAGAVVAAIIAGAQVVNYSDRNVWGVLLAAIAVIVALFLAILLLIRAAKILATKRRTATDLANDESRARLTPDAQRLGQIGDPKVEWLLARGPYLLGSYANVTELLSAYEQANTQVQKTPDYPAAVQSLADLRQRIGVVEEAAHYRDVLGEYETLLSQFRKGATLFVIAVILFSVSGFLRKPEKPTNSITGPVPVRVVITDTARPTPTPAPCRDRNGVAIGGTLTSPTVVMPPTDKCAAETLTPQKPAAVVIPQQHP